MEATTRARHSVEDDAGDVVSDASEPERMERQANFNINYQFD